MAELTTPVATSQAAARLGSRVIDGSLVSGALYLATISYVATGEEATGDTIDLCYLPAGARVVKPLSTVQGIGLLGAITVDVGTVADDDLYADGVALSNTVFTAEFSSTAPGTADADGVLAKLDGKTLLRAKLGAVAASSADIPAAAVLVFYIAYTLLN